MPSNSIHMMLSVATRHGLAQRISIPENSLFFCSKMPDVAAKRIFERRFEICHQIHHLTLLLSRICPTTEKLVDFLNLF